MPTNKILKEIVEFFGKKLDRVGVEIKGVSVVTLKGDKGETPTEDELLSLIKPLIPEPIKGDKGDVPSKEEMQEAILPLIPDPIKGDTPSIQELESIIKPLIPEPIPGEDGKTPSVTVLRKIIKPLIPSPIKGDDGSPDTGEEIIQKVNEDKSDRLIRKGKVEGMDEIEQMARTADANARSLGGSGSFVYAHDLSASLDGVTKTFTLPANARVILAFASSTPGVFRPTIDYTTTASTITFTSEISAASTLAAGQTVIILYKIL